MHVKTFLVVPVPYMTSLDSNRSCTAARAEPELLLGPRVGNSDRGWLWAGRASPEYWPGQPRDDTITGMCSSNGM